MSPLKSESCLVSLCGLICYPAYTLTGARVFQKNRKSFFCRFPPACPATGMAIGTLPPSRTEKTGLHGDGIRLEEFVLKENPARLGSMAENMRLAPKSSEDLLPTRQSLLSRLKDWEDADSWQEFFNRYWKLIYGVAIKSGLTEVEAQEVVQETIIAVSKKMPDFKYDPTIGSFKGWLLNMTRWRITDQLRKRQRESGPITRPSEQVGRTATIERIPDPATSCLENLWDQEWQNNLLEMAVEKVKRRVKPKQYQIFDLYVVKKWPIPKIVSTLGVNMGQIYLAKHRISALI